MKWFTFVFVGFLFSKIYCQGKDDVDINFLPSSKYKLSKKDFMNCIPCMVAVMTACALIPWYHIWDYSIHQGVFILVILVDRLLAHSERRSNIIHAYASNSILHNHTMGHLFNPVFGIYFFHRGAKLWKLLTCTKFPWNIFRIYKCLINGWGIPQNIPTINWRGFTNLLTFIELWKHLHIKGSCSIFSRDFWSLHR